MTQLNVIDSREKFFVRVINSRENKKILNATGHKWHPDFIRDGVMEIVVFGEKSFSEIKNMLESLSARPYPGF